MRVSCRRKHRNKDANTLNPFDEEVIGRVRKPRSELENRVLPALAEFGGKLAAIVCQIK